MTHGILTQYSKIKTNIIFHTRPPFGKHTYVSVLSPDTRDEKFPQRGEKPPCQPHDAPRWLMKLLWSVGSSCRIQPQDLDLAKWSGLSEVVSPRALYDSLWRCYKNIRDPRLHATFCLVEINPSSHKGIKMKYAVRYSRELQGTRYMLGLKENRTKRGSKVNKYGK